MLLQAPGYCILMAIQSRARGVFFLLLEFNGLKTKCMLNDIRVKTGLGEQAS